MWDFKSDAGDAKKRAGGESTLGLVVAVASGFRGSRAGRGVWGVPALAPSEQAAAPRRLPAPHRQGFVEGFLAAELLFVLVCVLRLSENSVSYPKPPSIIFSSL